MNCRDCRFNLACYAGGLGNWGLCPKCGRTHVTEENERFGLQHIFYCEQLELTAPWRDAYENQSTESGSKDGCVIQRTPGSPLDGAILGGSMGPGLEDAIEVGPHQGEVIVVDTCRVCVPRFTLPGQHAKQLEPLDRSKLP